MVKGDRVMFSRGSKGQFLGTVYHADHKTVTVDLDNGETVICGPEDVRKL